MAIFKADIQNQYAQIPNSTLRDESLTFEARGLLSMLLSMPPNWEVNKSWVISKSPAGKDKVNTIFKELIAAGYIRKSESQRKNGKFSSDDYFIFPSPLRDNRCGATVDGSAVNGKSAPKKERVKEEISEEEIFSNNSTFVECSNSRDDFSLSHQQDAKPVNVSATSAPVARYRSLDDATDQEWQEHHAKPESKTKAKRTARKTKAEATFERIRTEFAGSPLASLPDDMLADWIRHKKNDPSDRMIAGMNRELGYCIDAGINPSDAVLKQLERGWVGLDANWIIRERNSASLNSKNPEEPFDDRAWTKNLYPGAF